MHNVLLHKSETHVVVDTAEHTQAPEKVSYYTTLCLLLLNSCLDWGQTDWAIHVPIDRYPHTGQDRTEVNKGTNRRGGEIMYNHSEKAFISQKQFNTIPQEQTPL